MQLKHFPTKYQYESEIRGDKTKLNAVRSVYTFFIPVTWNLAMQLWYKTVGFSQQRAIDAPPVSRDSLTNDR